MPELEDKSQEKMCRLIAEGMSVGLAYERSGLFVPTHRSTRASQIASRSANGTIYLNKHPECRARIAELEAKVREVAAETAREQEERAERLAAGELTPDEIVAGLVDVFLKCRGERPIKNKFGEPEWKFDPSGACKSGELLGRHHAMKISQPTAVVTNVNVNPFEGQTIDQMFAGARDILDIEGGTLLELAAESAAGGGEAEESEEVSDSDVEPVSETG